MGDINYRLILSLLASQRSKIPFMDTYLIQDGQPIALFSSNKNQECIFLPEDLPMLELLCKIQREVSILSKLGLTGSLACYIFINKTRHKVSLQDLDLITATEAVPDDIELIQIPKPNMMDGELSYSLLIDKNECSLFHIKKKVRQRINDLNIMEALMNIARELIDLIETNEGKTMQSSEFEFTSDLDGRFNLANCSCKMMSKGSHVHNPSGINRVSRKKSPRKPNFSMSYAALKIKNACIRDTPDSSKHIASVIGRSTMRKKNSRKNISKSKSKLSFASDHTRHQRMMFKCLGNTSKQLYKEDNHLESVEERSSLKYLTPSKTDTQTSPSRRSSNAVASKSELRDKYRKLKTRYFRTISRRKQLSNNFPTCSNCTSQTKSNQNTRKALSESLELTNYMLKEIYRTYYK